MRFEHSFRFADPKLNSRLLTQLRAAKVRHAVSDDGEIRFSADDEERIEGEILGPIRDGLYQSWQLIFCPPGWAVRYQTYMKLHKIRFEEQWMDGQPCFLLSRRNRPHTWKLAGDRREETQLVAARGL